MTPTLRPLALLLLTTLSIAARAGTALDPGFADALYATLPEGTPTCIAWAPDGSNRLFVAMQEGTVRIIENGALRPAPFVSIAAYTQGECGVLGLCFDPHYALNRYVYVFVTVSRTEQRIVRFTDVNNLGAARTNIVTKLPTLGENHDGGALGFGHDGKLYWGIGDLGDKRGVDGELKTLAAKVGRASADGSAPTSNPFHDGSGPNNDYIWATGFRNPFTLTFQPRTGKLFLNVAGSTPAGQTDPNSGPGYEQVFALFAGLDGGYDDYEGNQPSGARYTTPFARQFAHPVLQYVSDPSALLDGGDILSISSSSDTIFVKWAPQSRPARVGEALKIEGTVSFNGVYTVTDVNSVEISLRGPGPAVPAETSGFVRRLTQGSSITGGTFYESTAFPATYRGTFFYGDYTGDRIMRAKFDLSGNAEDVRYFVSQAAAPVDIAVGPDGALYYASIGEGSIRRVSSASESPALIVTPTSLPIMEGGTGVATVRLSHQPLRNVTVHVDPGIGSPELKVGGPGDLTFTREDWSQTQIVTFVSSPDLANGDQIAAFRLSATGYPDQTISVKGSDTSAFTPTLSTAALTFTEGTSGTFTVQLPSPPVRPVTLTIRRTIGPRTVFTRDAAFVFTERNWNVPRTVRVVGRADSNATDETATFTIAARGYDARRVLVTVREPQAE